MPLHLVQRCVFGIQKKFGPLVIAFGSPICPLQPTKKKKKRNILFQIQRLFAHLQSVDEDSTTTKLLTKSFGWDESSARVQHDVSELNKLRVRMKQIGQPFQLECRLTDLVCAVCLTRILYDALEKQMRGTHLETFISDTFRAQTVDKRTCLGCGCTTEREDTHLDFGVTVAGHVALQESLTGMVWLT